MDDREEGLGILPEPLELLTWDQVREQTRRAEELVEAGRSDAALLLWWAAFEAALRRHAIEENIPADRMPTSALLKHLYSSGELSIEQYDLANHLLQARNRTVHGFQTEDLGNTARELGKLLGQILADWRSTGVQSG